MTRVDHDSAVWNNRGLRAEALVRHGQGGCSHAARRTCTRRAAVSASNRITRFADDAHRPMIDSARNPAFRDDPLLASPGLPPQLD